MNRLLPLSLAVALALGSNAALALGLGGINVKSELNEPLRAEIPVYVSSPAEAESLRVELAAGAEFARVGLDINDIAVPLEFDVGKNARGEPVILVKSNQAIREPTLTFLVEVNWSNGRFLREYSVLLEPPVTVPVSAPSAPPSAIAPAASVQPIAEPEAATPTPISEPEPLPEPMAPEVTPDEAPAAASVDAEPAPIAPEPEMAPSEPLASETPADEPTPVEPTPVEPAAEPTSVATAPSASEYGPIASGETLWEIANTTRPGNVTPSQMMIALLRANPDAFYRDNVSALKRGAILRIPGESDLQAMSAAEAAAEIVSQNQSWIESTRPTMVADASVESSMSSQSTGAASTRPGSRLELLPPATGQSTSDRPGAPGGTGESTMVRAELARTRESLSSAQQESGELRSRVKELETINSTNQRLLTLKDSELKNLQDKLKTAAAAAAQAAQKPVVVAVTPEPVVTPVETPVEAVATVTEPVAADPLATTTPDTIATDTISPDPTTPDMATDPLATAEPIVAEDITAPAEVMPIADADPVAVGEPAAPATAPWYGALMNKYVLGGLGLLVLGGLGFAVARRRKPEAPAVVPGSISGHFGDTVGGDNEESSMLSALAQDPTDLNAHLNVLEFYYMRRNADKFEAASEAMYAQLPDPTAAEWQGALLMGRDLCPTHPLFSDGEGDDAPAGEHAFADPFVSVPKFDGHAPKSQSASMDDDFDFDLGAAPPSLPAEHVAVADPAVENFDFNLADGASKASDAASPKQGLSFDFDLDTSVAAQKASEISFDMPELDLGTDLPAPTLEPTTQQMTAVKDDFLGDDAVATKIDLARAYLDMGDADGARSMLEEVVSEGSEAQKSEAKRLLTEIK